MIVGIDLGTTNSLIGLYQGDRAVLIPNALGHLLTPSAVSLAEGDEILVGLAARERKSTHPRATATAFKRWMGSTKKVRLGDREFRPEELSALVLASLKRDAEHFLGEKVGAAVITVPAYFNEAQRRATRAAGLLAGFEVDCLLNEPTAAGLAYGLQTRPDHTQFLVFDLGGGTFDVSVLEYFEGVVQVRASAGDTQLGGEDFVAVLADLMLAQIGDERERGMLRQSPGLWHQAESLKRLLSDAEVASVPVPVGAQPGGGEPGALRDVRVLREDFERASQPLLERIRKPIERALGDARVRAADLHEIILVGGATRMPMIRQLVTRLFQRLPLRLINPDETVAIGAATQAALRSRAQGLEDVVLTDVMPYSLGISTAVEHEGNMMEDVFAPIIERNQPVPVSRSETFSTTRDHQIQIKVEVLQGESPLASENLKLGELMIDVPRLPKHEAQVDVRFSYDSSGLIEVDVTSLRDGKKVHRSITQAAGMTPAQMEEAHARLARLKIHPRELEVNRHLIERAKRVYAAHLGSERQRVQSALNEFLAVLERQDTQQTRDAAVRLTAVLDQLESNTWL